jgi:hypothetical protein
MAELSYTIDASDTIVSVNSAWDAFALGNDGDQIVAAKIIGKPLDAFIQGDETRMFVRTMIMSARILNRPVLKPYRCDAPDRKRFMEMTVQPLGDGKVEVLHHEVHSEPIANPVRMVSAPKELGGVHVKRCSVCNRVRLGGVWSELDEAVGSGRLVPVVSPAMRVIYGVCPECLADKSPAVKPSVQKPAR